MVKPLYLVVLCSSTLILTLFFNIQSYAEESTPSGFSGNIMVGGAFTIGDPSLDDALYDENRRIVSLSQSPKSISEPSIVVIGGVNYTFSSTGTILSLGSISGPGGLTVTQPTSEAGVFSLGVNYMEDEVWRDPFIIGTNRSETDREIKGVALFWGGIMNSGFTLSYTFDDIEIDNDVAGIRNHNLRRDGARHTVKTIYLFSPMDSCEMSAGVLYERADMTGKSHSYDGYGIELTHALKGDGWDLKTGLTISFHDHDVIHPEFNKIREEKVYTLESAYTIHEPFGFKQYFITLFSSATLKDSNIDFYEETSLTGGLGIGYEF